MDKIFRGWQIYPGHITRELGKLKSEDLIRNYSSDLIEVHEDGLISYEIPEPKHLPLIWSRIRCIPWVVEQCQRKGWGWSPSSTRIDWLPIYYQYMPTDVELLNHRGIPCQSDQLHFLIDRGDPGLFSQRVIQHTKDYSDERNLKYFEDKFGEDFREDMKADRVKVWFEPLRKRPSKELWKGLEDTLVRWLEYSKQTPPPVGGAKAIHELKMVDIGEKKKGMYCELDLTDTRQETVEAMLAMVATYSETVFPLEYIFFA